MVEPGAVAETGRALRRVSDGDLERLADLLRRGRLERLDETGLTHAGFEGPALADLEEFLQGLEPEAACRVVQAVRAERRACALRGPELVWTGPTAGRRPSRDTRVVLRELFSHAEKRVLMGGYTFDHGEEILAPLHRAMAERGVQAQIFLHVPRTPQGADPAEHARKRAAEFRARNWPFGEPLPPIYYDPRTVPTDAMVSLHAKCVVVDHRWSLVGSANFTDRGLTRNVEAGVLLDDKAFAERLAEQWMSLVDAGLMCAV